MAVQPTIQCPKIVKVIQGEQAIISCNVTGDPTPNITWTKESQFGNVICHNSTLVMDNVHISDGGKYKITANNGRSTSDVVKLEILCKYYLLLHYTNETHCLMPVKRAFRKSKMLFKVLTLL